MEKLREVEKLIERDLPGWRWSVSTDCECVEVALGPNLRNQKYTKRFKETNGILVIRISSKPRGDEASVLFLAYKRALNFHNAVLESL